MVSAWFPNIFIAEIPDDEYIIGLQKKSVAIYAMGKERYSLWA